MARWIRHAGQVDRQPGLLRQARRINRYLSAEVRDGELWYGHADMNTGARTQTIYGVLDAFMLTLGDLDRARCMQESGPWK
ncbi:hypothetical protein [Pseudoxanthomonas sp. CF125]|uniref:hypothetical protein n=1 Tax=Pseudoxanthomonas sp. CF125 TaxID=1855303 RepID=UPI00088845BA|nr:hypothetical protein [Pseudoxanthomonas sp. CF125]SDQ32243.1 hypothetical protein SAMN05216569_0639 [Pseudoxanthomonas sp. CF125]